MTLRSESGINMAFNRVKSCLVSTAKRERKASGERVRCLGVTTTTIIDVDGDIPPPPKERINRQNTARGSLVRGSIANNAIKGRSESGEISECEGGDQDAGGVDSNQHS